MAEVESLGDLQPDPANARAHNPRNVGMIADALNEVGAARSIVIDEDGTVLAGNATIEAAAQAGIERVRVVDADGEEIIAVRRRGLTPEQKKRLAYFDNRTAELAAWDAGQIVRDLEAGVDLSDVFYEDELAEIVEGALAVSEEEWTEAFAGLPVGDKPPFEQMTFILRTEQAEVVRQALSVARRESPRDVAGNSNGDALSVVCVEFLESHG